MTDMKRFFNSMLVFAGAAMMLASCGETSMKVNTLDTAVNEALMAGREDSLHVVISLEYPVANISDEARKAICDSISAIAFGQDYAGLDLKEAAGKWSADYVRTYHNECEETLKLYEGNGDIPMSSELNRERYKTGYFTETYKNIASYTYEEYFYEGGAHGSTVETALNFDLESGKVITEAEFFKPGYEEKLAEALTAHLREAVPDQESYDTMFTHEIKPNGNFNVSEQGVTYIYNQYEIAPYSMGAIHVSVPWDEIRDLIHE